MYFSGDRQYTMPCNYRTILPLLQSIGWYLIEIEANKLVHGIILVNELQLHARRHLCIYLYTHTMETKNMTNMIDTHTLILSRL